MGAIDLLLFLKEEKTFVAKYDDISFLNGGRLLFIVRPQIIPVQYQRLSGELQLQRLFRPLFVLVDSYQGAFYGLTIG